ncbi:MAG: SCP2 sterol-binding domain-containing protein [Bacillota bacterium]|nr:SCP2 sterol-binding domain-containing protein [Bacillota bacterium]MDW7683290.1 SCP2 sterol-binding domain-containing protein [Bacillota bacterium]
MTVFSDARELYDCIGGMMQKACTHPEMGPKIQASGLIIRFRYTDPESQITIDTLQPQEGCYFRVICGPNDLEPTVDMSMTADVAHQFWLGKVNLTAALTRGQIKAKGPIQDILKMLPAIKPAYTMYPQHLRETGFGHLADPGR